VKGSVFREYAVWRDTSVTVPVCQVCSSSSCCCCCRRRRRIVVVVVVHGITSDLNCVLLRVISALLQYTCISTYTFT